MRLDWRDDEAGRFSMRFQGDAWGYALPTFLPVDPPEPPVPDKLNKIVLYIHDPQGWRIAEVPVTDDQQARAQPGVRWIDIGTVKIPNSGWQAHMGAHLDGAEPSVER